MVQELPGMMLDPQETAVSKMSEIPAFMVLAFYSERAVNQLKKKKKQNCWQFCRQNGILV